ncbi:hypothetical protein [Actinoalloteichus spitiensis]|uniref:hypothetical protein n=1 Tax=Actinoalloteichus spitiensis TaxID=252394 RepID=UPI0012F62F5A|nr:hypothetical protein [Actinoalloteichus spitiensis]
MEALRRLLGKPERTTTSRSRREYPLWWLRPHDRPVRHGILPHHIGRPTEPEGYRAMCGDVVWPAPSDASPHVPRCAVCVRWALAHADETPPQAPYLGDDADDD